MKINKMQKGIKMEQKTFEEMLKCVEDYDDGCAFYYLFQESQGLKFKDQYCTLGLRTCAGHLVDAVIKNGGAKSLKSSIDDPFNYTDFYFCEPPDNIEEKRQKFKQHGVEFVDFDEAVKHEERTTRSHDEG